MPFQTVTTLKLPSITGQADRLDELPHPSIFATSS